MIQKRNTDRLIHLCKSSFETGIAKCSWKEFLKMEQPQSFLDTGLSGIWALGLSSSGSLNQEKEKNLESCTNSFQQMFMEYLIIQGNLPNIQRPRPSPQWREQTSKLDLNFLFSTCVIQGRLIALQTNPKCVMPPNIRGFIFSTVSPMLSFFSRSPSVHGGPITDQDFLLVAPSFSRCSCLLQSVPRGERAQVKLWASFHDSLREGTHFSSHFIS